MGLAKLSIWVRDTAHPCLPYQSTSHSWVAIIMSCDLQPLHFGAVRNGVFPLTVPGKARGKVHGQVGVPPGCYLVVAVATCKNVFTELAMVQAICGQEVCVNLIPKAVGTCVGQLIAALKVAQILGPNFAAGCPAGREIPKTVAAKALEALQELQASVPPDAVLPALPITVEQIERMARKEAE